MPRAITKTVMIPEKWGFTPGQVYPVVLDGHEVGVVNVPIMCKHPRFPNYQEALVTVDSQTTLDLLDEKLSIASGGKEVPSINACARCGGVNCQCHS